MEIPINWQVVQKEIDAGDYSTRDSLRSALKEFERLINCKLSAEQQVKKDQHMKKLKALKPQSKVFYHGYDTRLIGKPGIKSKDGRTYMVVAIDGKIWRIPYADLEVQPMSESDIQFKKKFVNILSR